MTWSYVHWVDEEGILGSCFLFDCRRHNIILLWGAIPFSSSHLTLDTVSIGSRTRYAKTERYCLNIGSGLIWRATPLVTKTRCQLSWNVVDERSTNVKGRKRNCSKSLIFEQPINVMLCVGKVRSNISNRGNFVGSRLKQDWKSQTLERSFLKWFKIRSKSSSQKGSQIRSDQDQIKKWSWFLDHFCPWCPVKISKRTKSRLWTFEIT
jgi:hypothetical protein